MLTRRTCINVAPWDGEEEKLRITDVVFESTEDVREGIDVIDGEAKSRRSIVGGIVLYMWIGDGYAMELDILIEVDMSWRYHV